MSGVGRRHLLLGAGVTVLTATAARAGNWANDVGIYTEPTLAPALRGVGKLFTTQFGPGVAVLTAPATLLLEQIRHNAAHDLLIVPASFMDQAASLRYIAAPTRRDGWHDRLVITAAANGATVRPSSLAALLAGGSIAVTDATVASSLDGHAVLDTLGLSHTAAIVGVANTEDAAFMVRTGAVHFALVYETDVRANPALVVAAKLDATPPAQFAVALNPDPPSRNAQAFMNFLSDSRAVAVLRDAGLEMPA
jgi:ABC-type molybdate transport system substrate-binding protein